MTLPSEEMYLKADIINAEKNRDFWYEQYHKQRAKASRLRRRLKEALEKVENIK